MTEQTFKVIEILELQSGVSERGEWKSQEVVLEAEQNVMYPDRYLVTLRGDRTEQLREISVGDRVTAVWTASVRDWMTRDGRKAHSQVLTCWKIERVTQ